MTKQEIEQAIENGKSVWFADDCNEKVWEIDLNEKYKPEIYLDQILYVYQNINDRFKQELFIENIYKTKAEAEHYLNHANVTRTETLPFLTWEEFDKGNRLIRFIGKNGERCKLEGYSNDEKQSGFIDVVVNGTGSHIDYDYTEANFYKAYDECVRLFKGE